MMNRRIKLIWDFKGSDSKQTAEHHIIHLKEFIQKEKLTEIDTGLDFINDLNSIAYMIVSENEVFKIRDALMPHRAEIVA